MPDASQNNKSLSSVKAVIAGKLLSFFVRHPIFMRVAIPPLSYLGKPPSVDSATWDRQHSEGQWAYLSDLAEMPRYALIAGFAKVLQPESMLDVGCGAGVLVDWVRRDSVQQYVGIDVSKVAVEQARLAMAPQARFEVADGTTFVPDQKFDVIVFNEVLYYASDPVSVFNHYKPFLNSNGAFIVSMFRSPISLQTWRRCGPHLELVDQVRCRGGNGFEWDIRLCRPK